MLSWINGRPWSQVGALVGKVVNRRGHSVGGAMNTRNEYKKMREGHRRQTGVKPNHGGPTKKTIETQQSKTTIHASSRFQQTTDYSSFDSRSLTDLLSFGTTIYLVLSLLRSQQRENKRPNHGELTKIKY